MTNNKGKPYHVNMVFGRKLDLRQGIQWNYKNKANEEERKRKKKDHNNNKILLPTDYHKKLSTKHDSHIKSHQTI